MKIYLIRHGETDYNKNKRIQGQCDIELNDYGRELARITADGLKDVPFDIVFTSPLKRARETAEIITGDRNVTWVEEPRIQEISFGEYEGKCCSRENFNVPDKAFLNFFFDTANYRTPPGGESFEDIIKRTGDFLTELTGKKEYAKKTVLVSTHGCALKAILANIKHPPIEKFWGEGVHKNCAVTILEADNDKIKILEEGKLFYQ
ncbi:MAG: histidine phosphatase family protein [Suilimivivens sp.]